MARPVIGICTTLERARWSVWDEQALLVPRSYADAVQRAGGRVVLLPPDAVAQADPDEVLDTIDGLMVAGGADIDPGTYGAIAHAETTGTIPERDRFEVALVRRALDRDIPLLGICRGMQLLNVARGGTLIQHLPERFGHHEHRRVIGSFENADHDVRLAEGSLAERAAGESLHSTKSHHHQGIERVGDGLVVTGWAVIDDLPEAIEVADRRFALGIQWHPEVDVKSRVVAALVEAARDGRADAESRPPRRGSRRARK